MHIVGCFLLPNEPAYEIHCSMQRLSDTHIRIPFLQLTGLIYIGKTPEERAHLLETTPLFANIHLETAGSGQTAVPSNLDTDLHFTCFVEAPEAEFRDRAKHATDPAKKDEDPENAEGSGTRLIELDGTRGGPIDRGECKNFMLVVFLFYSVFYMTDSNMFFRMSRRW